MKKLIALLLTATFFCGVAAAANLSDIGYIDVQKVFKDYKETAKAQDELSKKEEAFKKEFEESQTKLEKAEQEGKKPEELQKMKEDLEAKLAPKRDELLKLNERLTVKLQMEILEAVKKVAKKVGVETVLDKQVVITGGMDLSEMVVNELNK
ncbi:MAG: OmpH family outer membrane protein [Candidatus Saganbacteria bacterium]|nr:OmpH family outer membrane protein [Candidatus Saganbacteria bacterium]